MSCFKGEVRVADVAAMQCCENVAPGMDVNDKDIEREQRDYVIRDAIHTLMRAKEIRADAVLMAEIRHHIREERDRLACLLDET